MGLALWAGGPMIMSWDMTAPAPRKFILKRPAQLFIQDCNLLEPHSKEIVGLHWKALNREEDSRTRLCWPWRQVGSIAEGFAWSMCPYNWWDGMNTARLSPSAQASPAGPGAEPSLGALPAQLLQSQLRLHMVSVQN